MVSQYENTILLYRINNNRVFVRHELLESCGRARASSPAEGWVGRGWIGFMVGELVGVGSMDCTLQDPVYWCRL